MGISKSKESVILIWYHRLKISTTDRLNKVQLSKYLLCKIKTIFMETLDNVVRLHRKH